MQVFKYTGFIKATELNALFLDVKADNKTGGFIECADGFGFSWRASSGHYCYPQRDKGPWSKFELGYPTMKDKSLLFYAEKENSPLDSIYPGTQCFQICQALNRHNNPKLVSIYFRSMNRKKRKKLQLLRKKYGTVAGKNSCYSATSDVLQKSFKEHASSVTEYWERQRKFR